MRSCCSISAITSKANRFVRSAMQPSDQLALTLGRLADGRYTVALMATNVVLRSDMLPTAIGLPYDNR